jgi:hypothetical protein
LSIKVVKNTTTFVILIIPTIMAKKGVEPGKKWQIIAYFKENYSYRHY